MLEVYTNFVRSLPKSPPRGDTPNHSPKIKTVVCPDCNSIFPYSPTKSQDTVRRCINDSCKNYVCTMGQCRSTFPVHRMAVVHQNQSHRTNARTDQCHFCSAPKVRNGKDCKGQCNSCGMYWCLFGDCTHEFLNLNELTFHSNKHK